MKLFIVILLALVVQNQAGRHMYSSEEDYRQTSNDNVQKELNDLMDTVVESYPKWQSSASGMPEASAYKNKVTRRIQNSNSLSSMPHLKEKLYKLADEKLQNCLKSNGQELDRHCVGRVTGQVMQLIAAVENSSRYTAYTGDRRHVENYY